MQLLKLLLVLLCPLFISAQHPLTFFTQKEVTVIKKGIDKYPLLQQSYREMKSITDPWLHKEVDVPFPRDPAGGYTHDRHKENYMLLFQSGILFNLTGNKQYAELVKKVLLKYAAMNPTLPKHPEATSSSPGRIFWQALNDANWLVYAGMAYDLVHNALTEAERKAIENGAFKPEVEYLTRDLQSWFDLIHNHGVWACAGVGIVGIASGNRDYVDMALYGTAKDGKSGFITQMDQLFSPDGYYTEGPYYVRYALLPYYLFANSLEHARPALKVFEHRDRILQKALLAGLQQTNTDGTFFALNDAVKQKDYTTNEMVTAVDIAWDIYGNDPALLPVAQKQGRVIINKSGAGVAAALAAQKNIPEHFPYRTVEYTDGVQGNEGGISLLRNGKGSNLSTLIYKYTSHGLSHGHFDKLTFTLYDKGNEIFTDYGSVRYVNVEQKYGGRYLRENDAYAAQTIAHNTLTVDETSHYNGKEKLAEQHHADKLFSDITHSELQVVAAKADNAYRSVQLQRTLYMIQLPGAPKMVVDVFNALSPEAHRYDLPFHYNGQLIQVSFPYKPYTSRQETMGAGNGYQFLWTEAEATVADTTVRFTFLNNKTYYSVSSWIKDTATVYFARTGANDPDFNLRHEPSVIIRKHGRNQTFVNVIEIHGKYDPVLEFSTNSYPAVQAVKLLQNDEVLTVVEILVKDRVLVIAQRNKDFDAGAKHSFKNETTSLEWVGPYTIRYDGKEIK